MTRPLKQVLFLVTLACCLEEPQHLSSCLSVCPHVCLSACQAEIGCHEMNADTGDNCPMGPATLKRFHFSYAASQHLYSKLRHVFSTTHLFFHQSPESRTRPFVDISVTCW